MLRIRPELIANLDAPGGLEAALEEAIKLEHSTIPPYLYALYSLKPGGNTEISDLISSVVGEEMAHMAMACNVLNAIGGSPGIDEPKFIPTYPGPLPGTVEGGLTVPLEAFSKSLVEKVFMTIEKPDKPLKIPSADLIAEEKPLTIGDFYRAIRAQIQQAGESIFKAGNPEHQVQGGIAVPEVKAVHDVATASEAIDAIIEQGEGTEFSPADHFEDEEIAHYYRFEEIVKGKELIPAKGEEPPWRYGGKAIPFDAGMVYPTIANPKAKNYPAGSPARYACETFNYTYTSLLKALHETFNGNPKNLRTAVGLMESMDEQAKAMMAMDAGSGKTAGPSFEYQPTNP